MKELAKAFNEMGIETEIRDVKKSSGTKQGLVVVCGTVCPTVYQDMIDENRAHGLSDKEIAERILHSEKPVVDNILDQVRSFESVEKMLTMKFLPMGVDESYKAEHITYPFLDMTAVVICKLSDEASFDVKKAMAEQWGVSEADVIEAAFNGVYDTKKHCVPMSVAMIAATLGCDAGSMTDEDVARGLAMMSGVDNITDEVKEEMLSQMAEMDNGMCCASCNRNVNGAIVVLDKTFMNLMREKFGGDFCVPPSSVHEVLFVPFDTALEAEEMNEMIRSINATELAPGEILSDHAYIYTENGLVCYK